MVIATLNAPWSVSPPLFIGSMLVMPWRARNIARS